MGRKGGKDRLSLLVGLAGPTDLVGPKALKALKDLKALNVLKANDSRLKAVKNAKCEVNFVPNKKAAPQFAFANEEPLIEVRCKIHPQSAFFLTFFSPQLGHRTQ